MLGVTQEANSTFGSINEALSKLEGRYRAAPGWTADDAALQLLRTDLAEQGEALSNAVLAVCSAVRTDSASVSPKGAAAQTPVRAAVSSKAGTAPV